MGAGGRTEESDGAGADDNVIRFPRDWFGSKDDLIPFGPAADRLEAAAGAQAAAEPEAAVRPGFAEPLNPEDFWGEGAGALHQPIEPPAVDPSQEAVIVAFGPVDDADSRAADGDAQLGLADARFGGYQEWRPGIRGVRLPRARVAAFGLLLVAALAMFIVFRGGGHGQPQAPLRSAAAQSAVVAPPDPLVTMARTVTGPVALDLRRLMATTRPSRSRRHARARRDAGARRFSSRPRSHASAPSASSSVGSSVTTTPAATVVASSADPAPPVNSVASTSASSGASAPSSSGPAGLGGVVGQQCNPQCSASGSH